MVGELSYFQVVVSFPHDPFKALRVHPVIMYELDADPSVWMVCGLSEGILALSTTPSSSPTSSTISSDHAISQHDSISLPLTLVATVSGFHFLPSLRLFALGAKDGVKRLLPVENTSKAEQVRALPPQSVDTVESQLLLG